MANKNENANLISILDALQNNPIRRAPSRAKNSGASTPVKKSGNTSSGKTLTGTSKSGGSKTAPVKKAASPAKKVAPAKKTTTTKTVTKSGSNAKASAATPSIAETASAAITAAFEKGYQQAFTNLSSFLKSVRKEADASRRSAVKDSNYLEAIQSQSDVDFIDFLGDYVTAARQHKQL
jgi:hypothetical protein